LLGCSSGVSGGLRERGGGRVLWTVKNGEMFTLYRGKFKMTLLRQQAGKVKAEVNHPTS
jgi:hypothetical protein